MALPRIDYRRAELLVLVAWHRSRGATAPDSEREVIARAACDAPTALRVWVIQRAASPRLIPLWTDGVITLRQLERIALAHPFDDDAQAEAGALVSPRAKRHLEGK